jgi:hypothetical protein
MLSEALSQIACVTRTSASYTCRSRAFRPRRETKSGSDKGICASRVGHTTTDNVSTTHLKGHVRYVVDTQKRISDNASSVQRGTSSPQPTSLRISADPDRDAETRVDRRASLGDGLALTG